MKYLATLMVSVPALLWAQGPPLYVSNYTGNQILKVDGTTGATSVLFTDTSASPVSPEGLVVGPDGRLWICDPNQTNSAKANILQLGQDGSNFQGFAFGLQFSPAVVPEGPSFDGNGELFFNTTGAAPPGGLGESFGHCV